ncbi:MAG: type II toxin-antitoxin system Phd/YefM family antitoxin [Alphaproteobacteria bacterium]
MRVINVHAAKTQLSRLIDAAAAGEEIVIARHGRPVARLVAANRSLEPRKPGTLKGLIRIRDDFDAPLPPDLAEAFGSDE